ncbi:B3 domain-containing protein At2g31720-like [Rutidosis leptorrhynchoides]|uniref:B3 domain-containing protein At2g31720-like n=1 Tax=Rutidosis leptorrhynchoides TaxID=125765 RepID=UPI003A99F840
MVIPTYSSFEECLTATTSSFKKRLILTEEDSTKSTKRLRFAKFEDKEYRYSEKVEQLTEKMKKFLFLDQLVTKIAKNKKKKMKIVKKMKRNPMDIINNEVTELLKRLIDEINGSDLKLLIQKRLYHSDLRGCQNRLTIPMNQMQKNCEFLSPDEENILVDKQRGIEVGLMGPKLQMYNKKMVLRKFCMSHTSSYVLSNNWNQFVRDYMNDLKENTMIQVWSFRRNQELVFAVVVVGDEENDFA